MISIDNIIYKKCFHEKVHKLLKAHEDGNGHFIEKVLFVSNILIDKSENGTETYEGLFNEEIHVAVKCIQKHGQLPRSKSSWMITRHPNLINCFITREHQGSLYVALERCNFSLQQLIEMQQNEEINLWSEQWQGRPTSILMRIISGVIAGVSHLHKKGLVHTNLNPSNILIVEDEDDEFSMIPKISSLDTCKQIVSLGSSAISRNRGWSAAEIIEGSKSLTPAIDSFSIGCILFFCISGGKHAFGDNTNVELLERRIQQKQPKNLYMVDCFCEARDLISNLIKYDPNLRLPLVDIPSHPIFWDVPKQAKFLRDIAEWLGSLSNRTNITTQTNWVPPNVFGHKWSSRLQKNFYYHAFPQTHPQKAPHYDKSDFFDLLRLFRNKSAHVEEIPENVMAEIGKTPNEIYKYFRTAFPRLFIEAYLIVQRFCKNEDRFQEYFTNPIP